MQLHIDFLSIVIDWFCCKELWSCLNFDFVNNLTTFRINEMAIVSNVGTVRAYIVLATAHIPCNVRND